MKLTEYRVREFRSVWDSGVIRTGNVTCFVGKNEAGKTALLQALYRLNPIVPSDARFDATDDYPRREVGDYQHDVASGKRKPAVVVEAVFDLEPPDFAAVEEVFGPLCVRSARLVRSAGYSAMDGFSLDFDEEAAKRHLAESPALPVSLREALRNAADWNAFGAALAQAETTTEVVRLRDLLSKFKKGSAAGYAFHEILSKRIPKFLYFDEYYQMEGRENVAALIRRKNEGRLKSSDYPLLGLINIARLKLEDLMNVQRTIELTNTLEGASNHLTRQILKYWSQNKHLQMKFDVREAKQQDPDHMRDGVNIWGRIYDSVHWATTELSSRSRGFIWFFSFLSWYEDMKRSKENVILLLDEPGLSLHGRAQADLLRYINEELKPHHQVLFTTHSPYMVDANHFERIRVVQDKGIDATEPLPREQDGTKVIEDVFDASEDSLLPLQGALGYEICRNLFVGPNCLIVEGPSDMLFLKGMSSILQQGGGEGLSEKWTITPAGGASKVPTLVALLAPQKGIKVATLLDVQASDRHMMKSLVRKQILDRKNLLTYAEVTKGLEADVEDMFDRDFYVSLINAEFASVLQRPLTAFDLSKHQPRVVRAVEDAFMSVPLKKGEFGRFRAARYFSEHLGELAGKISEQTKLRFAEIFGRLNMFLGG